MNKKIVYGAIAITFIVAVLALFSGHSKTVTTLGAVATSTTNLPSLSLNSLSMGTNCDQNFGSPVCQTTFVTSGTCTSATTTLFAIANPFSGQGTSTVTFAEIYGTQGATTTDIIIATSSTLFSGVDSSIYNVFGSSSASINYKTANFVSAMSIATGTPFYVSNFGAKTLLQGTSTNILGTTTINNTGIQVGPNENLIAVSTSTTSGLGNGSTASGFQPIPSICRYSVEWKHAKQ